MSLTIDAPLLDKKSKLIIKANLLSCLETTLDRQSIDNRESTVEKLRRTVVTDKVLNMKIEKSKTILR